MTMPPGTVVSIAAQATPNATASATGTLFIVGQSGQGPVGIAEPITSLAQYIQVFGGRTETSVSQTLYDAVDAFFQEGGQLAWVSRVFLASAIVTDTAKLILVDRAGTPLNTLTVSAQGPGAYGNGIQVAVTNGTLANTFVLTITLAGAATEVSPNLANPAAAVAWANAFSHLVTITNLNSVTAPPNNNAGLLSATPLAGGVDNTAPADADWATALATFIPDFGIGQVAAPGGSENVYDSLVTHAQANNRFALVDAPDAQSAASLEALAIDLQGEVTDPSYGMVLTPYVIYPGLPTNTQTPPPTRFIPPSGPVAGAMARLAAQGNNADVAAAGANGVLLHAIDVSTRYVDSDRAALEPSGVGVVRRYRGNVQLYGYTSLSLDPAWADVGNVRLRMQIVDGVRSIGDGFDFADIDAQGHTASAFGGQIASYLTRLWQAGALYGSTAAQAFFVNVGPSINTPATAQARQLLASVAVRMSPTAEFVIITVTKYPVSQQLPS